MFDDRKKYVAFDIETTGFSTEAIFSVAGLLPPHRHASLVLNVEGRSVDEAELKQEVQNRSQESIGLQVVDNEKELLKELARVIFERFERSNNTLVAYNGETWRGGFDIPYLRTKCEHHDVDWPLNRLPYLDLYEVIEKRFHTVVAEDSENGDEQNEENDLVGAHRLLCQPEFEFDPFEDSEEAVSCHYVGDWTNLLLHNLSDLHRTLDIGETIQRHASPRDLNPHKL